MGILLFLIHILHDLFLILSGYTSDFSLKTASESGLLNDIISYCSRDFSFKGCLYSENLKFFIIIFAIFITGFLMLHIGERNKRNDNQEKKK